MATAVRRESISFNSVIKLYLVAVANEEEDEEAVEQE